MLLSGNKDRGKKIDRKQLRTKDKLFTVIFSGIRNNIDTGRPVQLYLDGADLKYLQRPIKIESQAKQIV